MIENEVCEFKSEYTENIIKTVIAFANISIKMEASMMKKNKIC